MPRPLHSNENSCGEFFSNLRISGGSPDLAVSYKVAQTPPVLEVFLGLGTFPSRPQITQVIKDQRRRILHQGQACPTVSAYLRADPANPPTPLPVGHSPNNFPRSIGYGRTISVASEIPDFGRVHGQVTSNEPEASATDSNKSQLTRRNDRMGRQLRRLIRR